MIIDAHAHIFPSKIAEKAVAGIGKFYSELTMEMDGTVDTLIKNGKKNGIEKFVVQSVATTPAQVQSINDFIDFRHCLIPVPFPVQIIGFQQNINSITIKISEINCSDIILICIQNAPDIRGKDPLA